MQKNYFYLIAGLLVTLLCFNACGDDDNDKGNGDGLTTSVDLKPVVLDIPFSIIQTKADGDAEFYTFSGSYENLNLDDENFKEIKQYVNVIKNIKVKNISLKITKQEGTTGGTIVKSFTSKVSGGATAEYSVSEPIDLGESYSDSKLTEYALTIVNALKEEKTLSINAAGETDINPKEVGNEGTVKIETIFTVTVPVKDVIK